MVRCGIRYADAGFPGGGPAVAGDCLAIARHVATQDYPLALAYVVDVHTDPRAGAPTAGRNAGLLRDGAAGGTG
jgi:hypothetical protein